MVAVTMSRSRLRASSFLAMTAGSLVAPASAAFATPTIDDVYVANPTVGAWRCYDLTATGDLVLYPYPQRTASAPSANSARADGHTILGLLGGMKSSLMDWLRSSHSTTCRWLPFMRKPLSAPRSTELALAIG